MIKKIIHILESVPATVISGIFLIADLIPHIMDIEPIFHFAYFSVAISGIPLLYSAIRKLIFNKGLKRVSSALLVSIAMICAILIGDVFASGEVAFIMALGEILEEKTTARANKGIKKLINLTPKTGRLITDDGEKIVTCDEIQPGDILRVIPGETIPADGIIISGETSVDEAIMTGESMPIDKTTDDKVFCGTINRFGVIDIRATNVGKDSSLEKLIRMIRDVEDKKAPTERIADKWASILVPVSLLLAVICGIVTRDIVVAVTILVVFCPCALVLATPTAIIAGIGQATKHGVIIKSGEALENMSKVDTVVFDKTGTLTYGKLAVCDVLPCNGISESELLEHSASAESISEHPLGKAITAYAKEHSVAISAPTEFSMTVGKGLSAIVNGLQLYCGNIEYIEESNITVTDSITAQLSHLQNEGKATVIVANNNAVLGIIALSDVLRHEAPNMVSALKKAGVTPMLLTGDTPTTAQYFAEKAGISDVYSKLLPQDKVEKIKNLKENGKTTAMIGDGVNDAPALKSADVGIAMGEIGSDIAIDASDITLIGDDISKIPYLKRLSTATVRTIRFGITLSLLINLVGIILSVMKLLTPVTGALVHNAGSLFVILIATMLYDRKI